MSTVLIADSIHKSGVEYLKSLGLSVTERTEISPDELLSSISQYDALIVRSRTKVTGEIIRTGSNLKVIARAGSGVDNIDCKEAGKHSIVVVNAPDANAQSVVELTVGFMLSLLRHIPEADRSMKECLWRKKELGGSELSGKTVGIIGYGHIGKKLEEFIQAFGAKILIFSRSHKTASLETIFTSSDIISVHIALTPETQGLLSAQLFALMKPTAYFINTSRAEVVDEEALFTILSQGKIAGCALDVFWQEPLPADSRWRKLDCVLLSPHLGASTIEALRRASKTVAEDVVRVLKGEHPNNPIT